MTTRSDLSPAELESLLRFYAEAGVDCLLEEEPVDRFAETLAAKRTASEKAAQEPARSAAPQAGASTAMASADSAAPAPRAPAPAAPPPPSWGNERLAVPDEAAVLDARAAAAEAQSLAALREIMAGFTGCNLRYSAKNLVFADGNPQADIMFVGEAPGREEDIQGLPFVGRAGQLLDRMLAAIALDRSTAYIVNMIPWRPPGNRNPTPHEIELCRPFIERHIVLAAPKLVVFLGNVSNKALMNTTRGILSIRGTWGEYPLGDRVIPALPTLHPAYLLRNPAHKRLAWQDFLEIRSKFDMLTGTA